MSPGGIRQERGEVTIKTLKSRKKKTSLKKGTSEQNGQCSGCEQQVGDKDERRRSSRPCLPAGWLPLWASHPPRRPWPGGGHRTHSQGEAPALGSPAISSGAPAAPTSLLRAAHGAAPHAPTAAGNRPPRGIQIDLPGVLRADWAGCAGRGGASPPGVVFFK